ncbi:xanthine dehydrogenase family protein molybdopterin-binding subunit [Undibacter mobilis]|uniref:Xanthine dehydrogenase family protein molybdopterin-binding subunit n=1 Tax=Undibacter mobilis TaxID=2292256 RepID=A0A371B3A8_9BRAD|nr:xanthine dehydrogenase family protein molybdopterin-binding subunit [Undibacter mobilis]RDV02012.1 xanthine dehydrogenase family protein molybdopterin-binding subunit [Undibacter mobilis]
MKKSASGTSTSATKTFGQSTARLEDRDLLCGKGRFVADIRLPGTLHAVFVRSPHAHAKIVSIDKSAALALPGVVAVLTCDDIRAAATIDRLIVALPDKTYKQQRDRYILAAGETVYVGEAIAMVVATDAYLAEDAAGLVEIEFKPLEAAFDCRIALEPDAPRVHSDAQSNLVAEFATAYGDVNAAFAGATHVFKDSYWMHRGCATSVECRGCIASQDDVDGKLTLWSSTQTPLVGARILAELLGREETSVRVVAPDVGGGFGPKLVFYPEEAAVAIAAVTLGRPVRWIEDRREHFISTTQERDQHWDAEIALNADGKILGVRGSLLHDHGAYTARGLTVPQGSVAALTLPYIVPAYHMAVKVVLTNKVPVTPVRGAGQPQGVFVMERLLDRAARELKIDRAEIRRRNLVPASAMPYKKDFVTRGGIPIVLDSGDYPACQADALERAGWSDFPKRQSEALAAGRYLGIGLANFVEATGRGPYEQVSVRITATGTIEVATGAAAMGQSTKTMLAQVVAEQLGGSMERVVVTTGDSGKVSMGFGGFNSRQTVMAGSSAHVAAVRVREKALLVASHLLEVDVEDLSIDDDHIAVKGAAGMKISLGQIAKTMAGSAGFVLPGNLSPGLDATENVVIDAMTYGNGSAVAEVEVDIKTATVKIINIAFIHDAGTIINPMVANGQIVGAIAHAIGNTLFEWMGYDDEGQPVTTTLADYLLVTVGDMPRLDIGHRESPTPLNPLGVKGIGESGVLPIPAAIVSAVEDALSPFGVRILQFPIRPKDLALMLEAAGVR